MHELSIALALQRAVRSAAGVRRVEEVRVAVGELTAVEPELLRHAWQAAVRDGPDAGARLVVEWRPARQHCDTCGTEKARGEGTWLRVCPDCALPLRVEGGRELDLLEITCEDAEEETWGSTPTLSRRRCCCGNGSWRRTRRPRRGSVRRSRGRGRSS